MRLCSFSCISHDGALLSAAELPRISGVGWTSYQPKGQVIVAQEIAIKWFGRATFTVFYVAVVSTDR